MNLKNITVTDVTNIGDPFVLRVGNKYYLYATLPTSFIGPLPKKRIRRANGASATPIFGRPKSSNTTGGILCIIPPAERATTLC